MTTDHLSNGASPYMDCKWERAAATRWGSYITEIERRLIIQAQSLAGGPGRAVEIGCGSGRWSEMLSKLGWQMTCVETDPKALSACRKKLPAAKCVLTTPDAEAIPTETASTSLLLCIEVAEVIETDWFLPEAYRVLTWSGIFVGVCWNRQSWRGMACRLKYRLTKSPDARYFYKGSYSEWKSKLAASRFQVRQEEGLCWAPFGRTSNSGLIPFAVSLERALALHRLPRFSPWIVFIASKG